MKVELTYDAVTEYDINHGYGNCQRWEASIELEMKLVQENMVIRVGSREFIVQQGSLLYDANTGTYHVYVRSRDERKIPDSRDEFKASGWQTNSDDDFNNDD